MTVASMTGFSRATGNDAQWRWAWEARSVNGRGLDLRLRLPPGLDRLDQAVRNVVDWGLLERMVIMLSGIPIAVVSNIVRISSTGMVQEHFGPDVAENIFHDFAGWLMMPFACLLVALELWMLSRIFPPSDEALRHGPGSSREVRGSVAPERAVVAPVRGKHSKHSR